MATELLSVAGITTILVLLITVLFQYFPGLRIWWAGVKSEVKMLSVLALYMVAGALVAFGGCLPELAKVIPQLVCADATTFLNYVFAVFIAVGSGQGIFALLPEMRDVSAAKAARQG
jgi:hypothetical protein